MNEITTTTEETGPLSASENERLKKLERVISGGMMAFVEVGRALGEIRDNRLYRTTHNTFEEYVIDRWEISRPKAYRLIDCHETIVKMSPIGDTTMLPSKESHIRPLLQFPVEDRPKVWQDVLEKLPVIAGEKEITAKQIDLAIGNLIKTGKGPFRKRKIEIREKKKERDENRHKQNHPAVSTETEPEPAEVIESENTAPETNEPADVATPEKPDGPACPNCGSTEFDEDGDCTKCKEPKVVKTAAGKAGINSMRASEAKGILVRIVADLDAVIEIAKTANDCPDWVLGDLETAKGFVEKTPMTFFCGGK